MSILIKQVNNSITTRHIRNLRITVNQDMNKRKNRGSSYSGTTALTNTRSSAAKLAPPTASLDVRLYSCHSGGAVYGQIPIQLLWPEQQ